MSSGVRASGANVMAFAAPGNGGAAFVAGRKVGKAVQRNRARRVLRAAWSDISPGQEGSDVVFVARKGILGANSAQIEEELRALIGRLS